PARASPPRPPPPPRPSTPTHPPPSFSTPPPYPGRWEPPSPPASPGSPLRPGRCPVSPHIELRRHSGDGTALVKLSHAMGAISSCRWPRLLLLHASGPRAPGRAVRVGLPPD